LYIPAQIIYLENGGYMILKLACSCSLCSGFTSSTVSSVPMSRCADKRHNLQGAQVTTITLVL